MSSCVTPQVIHNEEDDDEFDWEAAVKEIDVACQGALSSTSRLQEDFPNLPPVGNVSANISRPNPKKPAGTRQSTLDKFIGSVDRRSVLENRSLSHHRVVDRDHIGGDDDNTVCHTNIDLEAAKTWIYPVNVPLRDYQLSITKTALFSNTLVALPTGLGKTLIAAVVMYNYFRWFPEGKIVFTAPSRPLVMQQIEACHNIVGIPQEWTIDMTGQTSPSRRAPFWKAKRVFFVTPQVLEKDIQSGTCLVKHLVCLVIDEAHRAMGNYSYCVAVRELMAVPVQLRILALTATPGSKQQTIQNVINNLNISTLEYRNESDHDVSPYVHNRKLELIEVAMGKDAIEINNLLLEAIQPFMARLCGFGVLHNRDFQTLSPCDLLNSRDKFRQAPPLNLPHMKYGEVEGYFGVLITLYHIRKLLSSHGIRPSYEMLEEKLQQGSFARLLSRNEVIWKAKLLMQQSLSHGAPNPKLSKMIEILIDHFKTNKLKNSRVIIFSNFRGSVRDIMDSLMTIGEFVKATEFIGQSSGKALKGQTQKIQQAVLQKFRAGGFNVIVATSIGEEGLDIMEVDLVICFDANVSPLRMIQRMGRTGRKHDGRVVILACEGSELKGYLRKQSNSKVVRKHMRNGGRNSFDFHPSPRMIPHICKPEVQFVELSIEQFVPRGRKVNDAPMHRPTFTNKVSDAETELIDKYFHPTGEDTWKPSLIAFPHFQAFPSRVHKVMHSFRTGLLIDTMQCLQGLSFFKDSTTLPVEDKTSSSQCLGAETIAQYDRSEKDVISLHDSLKAHSQRKLSDPDMSPTVVLSCTEKHHMSDFPNQNPPIHCFLFGADFVSVNGIGLVSITSVPALPFMKEAQSCRSTRSNSTELLNSAKQNSFPARMSPGVCIEHSMQDNAIENVANPAEMRCVNSDFVLSSRLYNSEQMLHGVERIVLLTPSPNRYLINSDDGTVDTPASIRKKISILLANDSASDLKDTEMSPRLTNMIEKGVVPESPIGEIGLHSSSNKHGTEHTKCVLLPNCSKDVQEKKIPIDKMLHSVKLSNCEVRSETFSPLHVPPSKLFTGVGSENLVSENENFMIYNSADVRGYVSAPITEEIHTPSVNMKNSANARGYISGSPVNEEIHTPLLNLTNNCSKDWHLSSGEASKSIQEEPKFKRLRKYGESRKRTPSKTLKENFSGPVGRSFTTIRPSPMKHAKVKQKRVTHVKAFIEEEAEVSDTEVSDDEEEDKDNNSYDDSFIDDRINPTAASTQAEANGNDMMAIYRRSLLSQSPMEGQPNCSTDFSPDILPCKTKTDETGSCSSRKISHSLQTPCTDLRSSNGSAVRSSVYCPKDPERISLVALPGETSGAPREERNIESRKRKLSFYQVGYGPAASLQPQQLFQSPTGKASLQCQSENNELNGDIFYDDQFYEGLDLDALEAQATKLLWNKSELQLERDQWVNPNPSTEENIEILNSPSFDLGI